MSIQTAYDAVITEALVQEPGTTEVQSMRCGVTADGVECVASIRVGPNYTGPAANTWELALDYLLGIMLGQESRVDWAVERDKQLRLETEAQAAEAAAAAEAARLQVLMDA